MARSIDWAGQRRWYEYHCYEGEDSVDAESWHHTHQQVAVLHKLTNVNEGDVGRMYRVRFDDGFECDAFEDELVTSPKKFYRPDYRSPKPSKSFLKPICSQCSVQGLR